MTSYSETYDEKFLISRVSYATQGVGVAVVAPPGASVIRVSLVGAGGWGDNRSNGSGGPRWGGGAAFAKRKTTCSPGEGFTLQIGDTFYSRSTQDTSLADTIVVRNTGSVVIAKADRGRGFSTGAGRGLAANSIGDVVRDGELALEHFFQYDTDTGNAFSGYGGASGSDLGDNYGVGVGGLRNKIRLGGCEGSGGLLAGVYYIGNNGTPQYQTTEVSPGAGRCVVEFFTADPGYS